MKKILNNLKENWITYGLETLVVIVGILIAFGLNGAEVKQDAPKKVDLREWEPGLYEKELAKGKIVWLTFSADWCVTCQVNEARGLKNKKVIERLKELEVVVIRADLTERNPKIEEALKKLGKSNIPANFIAVGKRKPSMRELPEIFVAEDILNALKQAEAAKK